MCGIRHRTRGGIAGAWLVAMRDLAIDVGRGTWKLLAWFVVLLVVPTVLHRVLWDENILGAFFQQPPWLLLPMFIGFTIAHEALHGLTFAIAGGIPLSSIRYGVMWKYVAPYAHPTVPLPLRAYRIGGAMPGIVLGLVPAAIGIATGHALLAGWGAMGIAGAGGDLMILRSLRGLPAGTFVKDHPDRIGCAIYEPGELS